VQAAVAVFTSVGLLRAPVELIVRVVNRYFVPHLSEPRVIVVWVTEATVTVGAGAAPAAMAGSARATRRAASQRI